MAALLAIALASSAGAVPLTANFDSLSPFAPMGTTYSEGGITFSSPTNFAVANGVFASVLFGWGGYTYIGNALDVHNAGWVSISAGGSLLDTVSFKEGHDWDGYAIEYGLLDTRFEWQAWSGSTMTAFGSALIGSRTAHYHGGSFLTVDPSVAFDTLRFRSTATGYAALPGTGGWLYDRGAVVGYGEQNHVAFDSVSVSLVATDPVKPLVASVPDGGSAGLLLALALAGCAWFRRTP